MKESWVRISPTNLSGTSMVVDDEVICNEALRLELGDLVKISIWD
jgi:hypothetical protein